MKVLCVSNQNYSKNFGANYKLSDKTIRNIEKTTGLIYPELTNLPVDEQSKLMKERGTIKKTNKIKTWIAAMYKKIGESLGLLKKEYNTYTDID